MLFLDRWRALSARIESLGSATEVLLATFRVNSSDPDNVIRKAIIPELESVKSELRHLRETYREVLPPAAAGALDVYLEKWKGETPISSGNETRSLQAVVPLVLFRSEFDYLLRDFEGEARSLTELALEHLRRLITVDMVARKKWTEAFKKRETDCERLGAVHLLSHGIWAFKVADSTAATDLVFGEPIEKEVGLIRATARALVLTEWKLVKVESDLAPQAAAARRQASLYAGGILSDLELKTTRYIVLVSERALNAPEDKPDGLITYRHIVLPVAPLSPSKEARVRSRRGESPHNPGPQPDGTASAAPRG